MPLTDTAIKNAKPRSDKLPDEKGLYLLVTINGGKWWLFDYRFDGKRKTLLIGNLSVYHLKTKPEISETTPEVNYLRRQRPM